MTDVEWTPAFRGQRPPFAPGNTLSVKHGLHSMASQRPIMAELITTLANDPELRYLAADGFTKAVEAWARAEAKVVLMDEYMESMSIAEAVRNDRGQTSYMETARKLEATAERARGRLGLDPVSAMKIRKDFAQAKQADAASILSTERAAAEAKAHKRSKK